MNSIIEIFVQRLICSSRKATLRAGPPKPFFRDKHVRPRAACGNDESANRVDEWERQRHSTFICTRRKGRFPLVVVPPQVVVAIGPQISASVWVLDEGDAAGDDERGRCMIRIINSMDFSSRF